MWSVLLAMVALGGNKWEGHESDVFAERDLPATPEETWPELDDVHLFERLLSPECVQKISYSTDASGAERVHLTYRPGAMRRKLSASLSDQDPSRWVDYDHPEPKGFVTRFKLEPEGDHTTVTVRTFINPPPWPFRGTYFSRIRPAWVQCWIDGLETLEQRVGPQQD